MEKIDKRIQTYPWSVKTPMKIADYADPEKAFNEFIEEGNENSSLSRVRLSCKGKVIALREAAYRVKIFGKSGFSEYERMASSAGEDVTVIEQQELTHGISKGMMVYIVAVAR